MSLRTVYFKGNLESPYYLEETRHRFVMRTRKGIDPYAILLSVPDLVPYLPGLKIEASFPDSDVYVYTCTNSCPIDRDELKTILRNYNHPDMVFVGSVFNYSNTGIFQIYTANIFIKFRVGVSKKEIQDFFTKYHLKEKRKLSFDLNAFFVESTSDHGREIFAFCEGLLSEFIVENCHPELVTKLRNAPGATFETENTGLQLANDWWLKRIGIDQAWSYTKGQGTTIAIIDDGLEMQHPAFSNKIIAPRDMMALEGYGVPDHRFREKHGTACASVACSADPKAPGVSPDSNIIPIRITGLGSVLQSEAIYWAVKNGADVISCSWGPPDGDIFSSHDNDVVFPLPDHTRLAFEYAGKHGRGGKGTAIVFAAGNGKEPVKNDGYASSEDVIAITSINHKNEPTIYSDYGPPVFACFPSGDFELNEDGEPVSHTGLLVADRIGEKGYSKNDYYSLFSGTSASSPGAAGIIALMYAVNPKLSLTQVKAILKNSSEKITGSYDNTDYNKFFGYGLLRADLAVQNTLKTKIDDHMEQSSSAISLHIGINHVDQEYYKSHVPPLYGCVNDMTDMGNLAEQLGYKTHFLKDNTATKSAILRQVKSLGNQVENGGILMITYAGHGAPIPNKPNADANDTDDNNDGNDEAWVTYDGFLLDDEIHAALAQIKSRIRVVLVSDSCHSESMTRAFGHFSSSTEYTRSINERAVLAVLKANSSSVEDLRRGVTRKSGNTYQVLVKSMSACLKDQLATEIGGKGVYTSSLIRLHSQNVNDRGLNYADFVDLIASDIREYQTPSIVNSHLEDAAFDQQFPFEIKKINESVMKETPKKTEKNTTEKEELFIDTDELLVTDSDGETGAVKDDAGVNSRSISSSDTNGYTAWDKAYNYLIENQDKVNFVEPDVISRLYSVHDESQDRSGGSGEYLKTYPNPEDEGNPEPFIWHLGDEHSGLKTANESVFPEIKQGAKKPKTKDLVKIGHIDTGYIEGHPSLPMNIDYSEILGTNTGSGIDLDERFAAFEQHGHGNATMSILAGNWVDYEDTGDNYKGFFGAIPYAKVLPIKISETVVLLSGKHFARAVNYAIDQGCDVITMSMAGLPSKVMAKAVNRAYEAGVIIVSAAGNSWSKGGKIILPKRTLYPARYDRVLAAVGATYTKRPYLNEYNKMTRAAGGKYMQTCYGPQSALPTSLAAYTPNITWFHQKEKQPDGSISYYVKAGGGTSSATPQIAAAAALYVQKYKKELSKYQGKNAWKKAEIVRKALFLSANKSTEFNWIFGNGLLKANDALQSEFAPAKLESKIKKAKKAPERRRFLGGIFGVFARGMENNEKLNEALEDMMLTEISQLLHKDVDLFPFLDEINLEEETISLDNPDLINKIIQSPYASDFLKKNLSRKQDLRTPDTINVTDNISSTILSSKRGDIRIQAVGVEYNISNSSSTQEVIDNDIVWNDEFELEISTSRSVREGLETSLTIEVTDPELESVMIIEKVYEDGTVYEWKHPVFEELNKSKRSVNEQKPAQRNLFEIPLDDLQNNQRFIGKLLKKAVIKIKKWAVKKVLKKLSKSKANSLLKTIGNDKYDIFIYDLKSNVIGDNAWQHTNDIDSKKIYQAISNDSKPVLILFQGLFRGVNKSFDEFLSSSSVREKLLKKHGRYIIGINMPTIVHRVEENANQLEKIFKGKFKQKPCTVMAMSRGGVVARHLFEENWVTKTTRQTSTNAPFKLNQLLMFGTPNQGTMIASSKNWNSLFNYATIISRITLGTIAPVVPTIFSAIKILADKIVDLPGIDDMEETSEVILKLNQIEMNRDNYFVFTSHFEPKGKLISKILDGAVDRLIFKGEHNDGVTPTPGAIFENEELANVIELTEGKQFMICDKDVSHFSYLDEKHTKVSKKLFDLLS